jgi:hypothetical protein
VAKLLKKSSSYNMSIFSSGATSQGAEIITATSEDSSLSIGELWPDIDKLDEISHEDTSIVHTRDVLVRGRRSTVSADKRRVRAGRRSRHEGNKALLADVPGMSNAKSKSCGSSFGKKEAVRISSAAPGKISPRMRRSFVHRRYSPSTCMGLSEWEVILEELTHIVKEEPNSDHNE